MVGTIRVLGNGGDTATAFDTDSGIVAEAEKVLEQASYANAALFDGATKEQITGKGLDKILSEHEEVLVVPPMAGG